MIRQIIEGLFAPFYAFFGSSLDGFALSSFLIISTFCIICFLVRLVSGARKE